MSGCTGGTPTAPSTEPPAIVTSGAAPSASPTGTSATPAAPSASATASSEATPSGRTCEPFGSTGPSASSTDWPSDLRTAPGDALWGVTMRIGRHECYDRWVLELDGPGAMPGWSVTPYAASTFALDGSGEDLAPALAGSASLDIAIGAWVDGEAIDAPSYAGPRQVLGAPEGAIREARLLSGFEGITHVGLGLDRARPYRVTWLTSPPRLVVDVASG